MIVGIDQKFWPRIARALDVAELIDDPRFARGYPRWQNRRNSSRSLRYRSAAKPPNTGWPACATKTSLRHSSRTMRDGQQEQVVANGYLEEQDHPRFGRQRVVGLHVQLSATPGLRERACTGARRRHGSVLRPPGS